MIELEKTYLAKSLPAGLKKVKPEEMVDIYVPGDPSFHHPTLRIRKRGKKLEITKKEPVAGDASSQTELTIPLKPDEYEALAKASRRRLVKDRYVLKIGGRIAEIDVFKEDLQGLVLIDFEFGSETEKQNFKMPDCCLADVTQENFLAGGLLAGKSYQDITRDLKRYDYHPL